MSSYYTFLVTNLFFLIILQNQIRVYNTVMDRLRLRGTHKKRFNDRIFKVFCTHIIWVSTVYGSPCRIQRFFRKSPIVFPTLAHFLSVSQYKFSPPCLGPQFFWKIDKCVRHCAEQNNQKIVFFTQNVH